MDAPPVQYVTTSDGMRIAYAAAGSGTPLLVLPGTFYHVQYAWEYPGLNQWLEALASHYRVILMDIRGTGMSSRDVGDDHILSHYQRDLEAVVGRLELRRFLLFAASRGVDIAVDYALTSLVATPPYPDHPSGYNCVTSALMHSGAAFFGHKNMQFSVTRLGTPNVTRVYNRFTDVIQDTIHARVYLGIHFRAADVQGAGIGRDVARWLEKHYFKPGR